MLRIYLLLLLLCCPAFSQAPPGPDQVARKLYNWALKADTQVGKKIAEARGYLSDELYSQLSRAYNKNPDDGEFLDFDPFSNTQMGASGYQVGKAVVEGSRARVPVKVQVLGGGETSYSCHLRRINEEWRVSNFVYSKDFDLLSALKAINGGSR